MSKTNNSTANSAANEEPKAGKVIKLGSMSVSKNALTIVSTIVVILLAFLGFKYLYLDPKEDKAQTLLTENEQLMNAQNMAQLDQILGEVSRAEAMLEQEMLKGDSANLALKDSLNKKIDSYKAARTAIYTKALNGDGKTPGLLKIAKEGMTSAANIAKAEAGICYYKLGNYKEAINMLEGFTPQGDKGISPQYIAALANCYAADGQLDKAVDTFKKAASEADNAVSSPQYLLEAGLLLESQKKNDEALEIYMQIKKDYPQSSMVSPQQMQGGYVAQIDKFIERVSK